MPSSANAFSSTSEASGSSFAISRSAISTTVTSTPNREKTCANSQPIGPPPSTTTDPGSSVAATASRLVQYGVPCRPVDRRRGRLGAGVEHDALAGGVRRAAHTDPAGTGEHAPAAHEAGAAVLEPLDRDGVVPVVGGLVTDPLGHRGPVGLDLRGAAEVGDPARVGDHVRGRDHHLRRHAAVVGALAADQPVLDPDDVEPGASQLDGDVLAAGSEPEHDHVDVDVDVASLVDSLGQVSSPGETEEPVAADAGGDGTEQDRAEGLLSTFWSARSSPPDFFGSWSRAA